MMGYRGDTKLHICGSLLEADRNEVSCRQCYYVGVMPGLDGDGEIVCRRNPPVTTPILTPALVAGGNQRVTKITLYPNCTAICGEFTEAIEASDGGAKQ